MTAFEAARMELDIELCKDLEHALARYRQQLENLKRMATGEEAEEEERKGERDMLRSAIEGTLPMMENGSQWFCIYRGMVDRELHEKGRYAGFVSRIEAFFPGKVPLGINAGDISKLDVGSWSKHLEEWTRSDAPRKGKTYTQYEKITRRFEELLASGD